MGAYRNGAATRYEPLCKANCDTVITMPGGDINKADSKR